MKALIITLSIFTLSLITLIVGLRLELNSTIETYNTKDVKTVKLRSAVLNNDLNIYSKKMTKIWFCKDSNFKHFDFKVRKSTNLFGTEKGTIIEFKDKK